jgi:hypothetical protein
MVTSLGMPLSLERAGSGCTYAFFFQYSSVVPV